MGASYVASAITAGSPGDSSITVNVPTGTVNNDIMILSVVTDDASVPSGVTGWTSIGSFSTVLTRPTVNVYYRVASSEPASYTATYGAASTDSMAAIATYRTVTFGTGTIVGSSTSYSDAGGSKTGTITIGTGTASMTQAVVVYVALIEASFLTDTTGTWTYDALVTKRISETFEYAGGGTLQDMLYTQGDILGFSGTGPPSTTFTYGYGDTFHAASQPVVVRITGLTGPAPSASYDRWG